MEIERSKKLLEDRHHGSTLTYYPISSSKPQEVLLTTLRGWGDSPKEVNFAKVTVAGIGLKLSLSHQVPLLTRAFSKQEKSDNYLQGSKQLLYLKYKDAKDQAFEIAIGKYGR